MHRHGGDIYTNKNITDFSANINFKGMPKSVEEAAKKGVEQCGHYPDTEYRELKKALSQYEDVPENFIVCGNGAAEVIFSIVLALKPKKALVTAPAFYEYEKALQTLGCSIAKYKLKEETGFELQDDFLNQITKEIDLVFLCNPNNPTGVLTEPEFLNKVIRQCERSNTMLVIDECFNEFLEEPKKYTMKDALMRTENLLILKAFTKIYGMAGLRLGYGLTNNASLVSRLKQVTQPWNVSIPAQMAGLAALKEQDFVIQTRKEIKEEKEFLISSLEEMGYPVVGSKANYIFFQGSRTLYSECLTRGFLIRDCSDYEGLTGGWYRIAVRNREDNTALLSALGWGKE